MIVQPVSRLITQGMAHLHENRPVVDSKILHPEIESD
jgi:hypothetical protein